MTTSKPREFFIQGITTDGRVFRPSDWAERLAGVMSQFRPGGQVRGPTAHLSYSPYCLPTVVNGGGRAATEAPGARWVNVLLGNVKRAINGTYHAIRQAKYARRYLAEAAYRFNRRFRLHEMLPRLATAMLRCKPCPEPVLRAASNFHG